MGREISIYLDQPLQKGLGATPRCMLLANWSPQEWKYIKGQACLLKEKKNDCSDLEYKSRPKSSAGV